MYLKKIINNLFFLIALLCITSTARPQATESGFSSKDKKMVIPTLVLMFLNSKLSSLANTTQSSNLFETFCKLKNNSSALTQEEKKQLSEYVKQETMLLKDELLFIKDNKKLESMQQTYQALTKFTQEIAPLQNSSFIKSNNIHNVAPLYRPKELLIPANGNCFNINQVRGYLWPENNSNEFEQRLERILGTKKTRRSQAHKYLVSDISHVSKQQKH